MYYNPYFFSDDDENDLLFLQSISSIVNTIDTERRYHLIKDIISSFSIQHAEDLYALLAVESICARRDYLAFDPARATGWSDTTLYVVKENPKATKYDYITFLSSSGLLSPLPIDIKFKDHGCPRYYMQGDLFTEVIDMLHSPRPDENLTDRLRFIIGRHHIHVSADDVCIRPKSTGFAIMRPCTVMFDITHAEHGSISYQTTLTPQHLKTNDKNKYAIFRWHIRRDRHLDGDEIQLTLKHFGFSTS